MSLKFQPKEACVVMCDFVGFVAPEMIKKRPVVVLKKHRHSARLVTVVPLSTTRPDQLLAHHVELPCYLPGDAGTCWAKCDMVYTVSLERQELFKVRSRHGSGREYKVIPMKAEHFEAVRAAVRAGLGL
ncbi:type II toxin-antitoxin system PemK/MazF family toxin [Pseudomonas sp. DC3000-4b1]|uniref:type II toxin-antitoxin system PemK/MazF family toxin n=1 Tax=unclassified Pseudomonas TaxID=196821 RepID=UPI003CE83675